MSGTEAFDSRISRKRRNCRVVIDVTSSHLRSTAPHAVQLPAGEIRRRAADTGFDLDRRCLGAPGVWLSHPPRALIDIIMNSVPAFHLSSTKHCSREQAGDLIFQSVASVTGRFRPPTNF